MPGILAVNVAAGDMVKKGQVLMVLEAMRDGERDHGSSRTAE